MVAQVDEKQAPVVAHAMDPAGQPDGPAGVASAQFATGVRAVAVHETVA
jgi:hypothetical protein